MKPFNLEEYLANPSRKVVTRIGRPVRIVCTDVKDKYPVVGIVKLKENHEETHTFKENGAYFEDAEDDLDLFFAPEKKECWVNVFKETDDKLYSGNIYETKEEAVSYIVDHPTINYVTTAKIEWEE